MGFEFIYIIIIRDEPCWKSKSHCCSKRLPCDYHREGRNSLMGCKPSIGKLCWRVAQEGLAHGTHDLPSSANPKTIVNQTFDGHSQGRGHRSDEHCQPAAVLVDNEITREGKTYIDCLIHD